jgi:hypothetical protein
MSNAIAFFARLAFFEMIAAVILIFVGIPAMVPLVASILSLMTVLALVTKNAIHSYCQSTEQIVGTKSEFDCPTYDQTAFEFRLAEAGIISLDEVTLCDTRPKSITDPDPGCRLCQPERTRRRKAARAAQDEQNALREERSIDFNGIHIVRPMDVPDYAEYRLNMVGTHGIQYVIWQWLEDGKIRYYQQPFAAGNFEVFTAESTKPVLSW